MPSRALCILIVLIQTAYVAAQPHFSFPSLGRAGGGSMPSFSAPSISGSAPSMPAHPSISAPSMPDRPSLSAPSTSDRPSITTSSFTPPSSSSSSSSLPDPSTALSTLATMGSTLSSVSSSLSLPDAFQSTARIMNQIPAIASSVVPSSIADVRTSNGNGDEYAGIPTEASAAASAAASTSTSSSSVPAATAAAAAAGAAPSPSSSQSLALSVAQASHSTPVRGVSPFPYTPVDFVDPLNNPNNRIPEQPRASCSQMEVACQAYKRCYPCYANRSLSFCPTCLNLIRARTANDQLKEMCALCKSDATAMAICSMSEPYCPL